MSCQPFREIIRCAASEDHELKAFTCFETLENGNTVVCAWNGHDPLDSRKRALLIEFDEQGRIIWRWRDHHRLFFE